MYVSTCVYMYALFYVCIVCICSTYLRICICLLFLPFSTCFLIYYFEYTRHRLLENVYDIFFDEGRRVLSLSLFPPLSLFLSPYFFLSQSNFNFYTSPWMNLENIWKKCKRERIKKMHARFILYRWFFSTHILARINDIIYSSIYT